MQLNRMNMDEVDHIQEEYKLFALNNGQFSKIESFKTLVVLQKRSSNGELKDAFKIIIKDQFLGGHN
jgi:predicted aldo/keto reductase-like oxidoreductase